MTPQDFQTIIREARKAAGLTQQELADKVGIAKFTVNQFEVGKQNITVDALCGMLTALDIHLSPITEAQWLAFLQIKQIAKQL